MFKSRLIGIIENFALTARDYIGQEAFEKMENFKHRAMSCFTKGFKEPYGDFQTIIHGDPWINNAIFKFENGQAVEIAMVDFQMVRVTSPVVDLAYLLMTGTRPDLRQKHEKKWLKIYFDQLSKDLITLGYEPEKLYTFEQLVKDFDHMRDFGLCYGLMHVQVSFKSLTASRTTFKSCFIYFF